MTEILAKSKNGTIPEKGMVRIMKNTAAALALIFGFISFIFPVYAFTAVYSDFEDNDTVIWQGIQWGWAKVSDPNGNIVIENEYEYGSSALCYTGSADWQNYLIKAKVRPVTGDGVTSIMFRIQDDDKTDSYTAFVTPTGSVRIIKTESYVQTDLGEFDIPFAMGGIVEFEILAVGDFIKVTANGVESANIYDSTFKKGYVGFGTWNSISQFDDISIEPADDVVYSESISVNQTQITITEGEYFRVNASVLPPNTTSKKLFYWSSDVNGVIYNNDGLLRGVKAGQYLVGINSEDKKSSIILNVTVLPRSFLFRNTYNTLANALLETPLPTDKIITAEEAYFLIGKAYRQNRGLISVKSNIKIAAELGINLSDPVTKEELDKAYMLYKDVILRNESFGLKKNLKLYEPEEEILYYVRNNGGSALTADVSFKNKTTGEIINQQDSVPAGCEIENSFTALKNGIYTIEYDNQEIDVGVCPRAEAPADKSLFFGIQPHFEFSYRWNSSNYGFWGLTPDESFDLGVEFIKWLGVNLWREGITPGSLAADTENTPIQSWNWGYYPDRLFGTTKNLGITLDCDTFAGTKVMQKYENTIIPNLWTRPYDTDNLLKVYKAVMDRYMANGNIIWELGNETNWSDFYYGTASDYIEQMTAILDMIETYHPNAVVSGPGLVTRGDKDNAAYHSAITEEIENERLTYSAYHAHGSFEGLAGSQWQEHLNYMADAETPWQGRLMLNETGFPNTDKLRQSYEMTRKILWAFGNNHKGVVYYQLRQYPEDIRIDGEGAWSLISNRGEPREMFVAYRNLINLLSGTTKIKKLYNDGVYSYIYYNGEKSVVAAFSGDDNEGTAFSLKETPDKILDMFGNEIEMPDALYKQPVYFIYEIHGMYGKEILPDIMTVSNEILTFEIKNISYLDEFGNNVIDINDISGYNSVSVNLTLTDRFSENSEDFQVFTAVYDGERLVDVIMPSDVYLHTVDLTGYANYTKIRCFVWWKNGMIPLY